MMENDLKVMEDDPGVIQDDLGVMEDDLSNLISCLLSNLDTNQNEKPYEGEKCQLLKRSLEKACSGV